jgi:DNA repair protein RecO (recombination protein O)
MLERFDVQRRPADPEQRYLLGEQGMIAKDQLGFSFFFRNICAGLARVIIKLVPRVRAVRTVVTRCSTQRRRADNRMPARETEAIILKTFPLGEADRLVSFLGRTSGRIRGVAGGARRLKNRYGSTLEVLSHVQLWYVEKETRDLVRIQQCELIESFNKAQSDYELSTGLAVVSEISELVLPEHEVAESMFRLILLAAREIERTADWTVPLSYFGFWAVKLGGWLPRFDRCSLCSETLGAGPAFYTPWEPGLVCEKCRRSAMRPLHRPARELVGVFTAQRLDRIEATDERKAAANELREATLDWIEHHTERRLHTRALLETT